MRIGTAVCVFLLAFGFGCGQKSAHYELSNTQYPITGIPFYKVKVSDNFWLPKIETNRAVTIPSSFKKCEETGRLENFLIAGGKMEGKVRGEMPFDDTDVYKTIEGASYSLATIPDSKLETYVDSIINIISTGQEPDGYLTTYKSIDTTVAPANWCPAGGRWKDLACSHELYNSGHLFEAAVAHYHATGKRNFLNIAIKNADLLVSVFGPGKNEQVPGHQIVETGLIKLYLTTKKTEYLNLARHFLENRGDTTKREIWGPYNQDHLPVTQQTEAVGHAVRALYMYAGMADIAALFNNPMYKNAVEKIWENVVSKKMYITGGVGAKHGGEAFGENYELPNLTAYNETCAAIANVYWNYRMFLLYGDSKFIDVLERSLYNGVIAGVALDGKNFFYPNPLSCNMHFQFNRGHLTRQPWFDCSCCPTNMCRFMPSVPGYIYAQKNDNLYINLFVKSTVETLLNNSRVLVMQQTDYPWNGKVYVTVNPEKPTNFTLRIRIPGWALNKPVPGDLYTYDDDSFDKPKIEINNREVACEMEQGFALITRNWEKNDQIVVNFPMKVRTVKANNQVKENDGKRAIERGPIVYCVEQCDNTEMENLLISGNTEFDHFYESGLLSGVEVIKAKGDSPAENFTAIPYYQWNNRGAGKMDVWMNYKPAN